MMARVLLLVGKEVLLTDEIYGNCVPIDMRGMLFCYLVTAYDVESKVFSLQYMKVMGALLNPLYQSDYRMIEAGLLTENSTGLEKKSCSTG